MRLFIKLTTCSMCNFLRTVLYTRQTTMQRRHNKYYYIILAFPRFVVILCGLHSRNQKFLEKNRLCCQFSIVSNLCQISLSHAAWDNEKPPSRILYQIPWLEIFCWWRCTYWSQKRKTDGASVITKQANSLWVHGNKRLLTFYCKLYFV